MSSKSNYAVTPPPLPETVGELLDLRMSDFHRTINDLVEEVHLKLWPDANYRKFLYAVHDSQAIEGSVSFDNHEAATMIREYARKTNADGEVALAKKATINTALAVVLRRYGISRKQRRNMLHGEKVPPDNGDNE